MQKKFALQILLGYFQLEINGSKYRVQHVESIKNIIFSPAVFRTLLTHQLYRFRTGTLLVSCRFPEFFPVFPDRLVSERFAEHFLENSNHADWRSLQTGTLTVNCNHEQIHLATLRPEFGL